MKYRLQKSDWGEKHQRLPASTLKKKEINGLPSMKQATLPHPRLLVLWFITVSTLMVKHQGIKIKRIKELNAGVLINFALELCNCWMCYLRKTKTLQKLSFCKKMPDPFCGGNKYFQVTK